MFGANIFAGAYFAQGPLGLVEPGPGDIVTTANAYFRRRATSADGMFVRTATAKPATFRRSVTTQDTER